MNHNPSLYRPGTLIRDFHENVPAYYGAKDVAWSPFTKIGNVTKAASTPVAKPRTIRYSRLQPAAAPLFHDIKAITEANKPAAPVVSPVIIKDITPAVSVLPTKHHVQFVPKKYTLEKGLTADFTGRTFKASGLGILACVVLLFGLIALGPKSTPQLSPAGHQTATSKTPANNIAAMMAAKTTSTSTGTSAAPAASASSWYTASPSGSWAAGTSASGGNSSTTATGGYGGAAGDTGNSSMTGANSNPADGSGNTGNGTGTGDSSGDTGNGSTTPPVVPADPIVVTVPPVTIDPNSLSL